jgi:polar amino acid transport system substrate-binding protein
MLFHTPDEFYTRTGVHMSRAYLLLFLFVIGVIIMSCSPQTDPAQVQAEPARHLRVGTSTDYPPFSLQREGQIMGLEIDWMQAIAEELGYTVQFLDIDFPGLIPALKSRRIDAVIASLTVTPERAANVDFTEPYYTVSSAVLFREPEGRTWLDLGQWANKTVGFQLGSSFQQEAEALAQSHPSLSLKAINKTLAMVQELKLGHLDAVLMDEEQAKAFVQSNPGLGYRPLHAGPSHSWAIAVNPGDPLKEKLNEAIRKLKAQGQLHLVQQRWLLEPLESAGEPSAVAP